MNFFELATNRRLPITATYNVDSKIIKQVSSAKHLGITINKNKFNWSVHISNISKKAISALGFFLLTTLKSCPSHIKESCYKFLVMPILELACTIWDPHTQKRHF